MIILLIKVESIEELMTIAFDASLCVREKNNNMNFINCMTQYTGKPMFFSLSRKLMVFMIKAYWTCGMP